MEGANATRMTPSLPTVARRASAPGTLQRMPTVYDLTLEQLTDRLVAWGEPAFRAKQVWRSSGSAAATYDQMPDVPPALRERLAAGTPARGRGPGRTDRRPWRHPQSVAQARRPARRRGGAHGLPRSRHGRACRRRPAARWGARSARPARWGCRTTSPPARSRRRRCGRAARRRETARHDAAAADERRVHGDGGALREPASRLRRARSD